MELAGVELRYVARELQSIIGAKVEKVFQSERKRDLYFILYVPNAPKFNLRFVLPGIICSPRSKPDYPTLPPGFAMFLRKYLSGTRVTGVEQRGMDRTLHIMFASKTDKYTLVVEMMPPGNMLLLDKDNRIINLLENQQTKDRSLRGKQPYVPPPAQIDVTAMTEEELAQHISVSTKDSIVTTLAINCALGGIYAEEVCVRAGIAKHRNDLNEAEVAAIAHNIKEILDQPIQAHQDEQRAYPFRLQSRDVKPAEESSYLAAICNFITEEPVSKAETRQRERAAPKTKLQNMIDAQTKQIRKCEEESKVEQRKAERIYEEYQLLNDILTAAKEAREKKRDIEGALKGFPQVKSYKPATGEIEVEL